MATTSTTTAQPSGFFQVFNDLTGTLAKTAENYYDVQNAKNENTVTPKPVVNTPGKTPGTTNPDQQKAASKPKTPTVTPMSDTLKIALIGGGSVVVLGVLFLASRKK